jgi:outer membrane protein OmpA-like peptidoglycan-associated protein
MSKKLLCLLGILLTIIAGSIIYWIYCCDCGAKSRSQETMPAEKSIVTIPIEPTAALPDTSAQVLLLKVKERLNADPLILYFGLNKAEIALTDNEQQKLKELYDYMIKVSNDMVTVTGHTDNTGSRDNNMSLAMKRAEFVKAYLVRNGIGEARIEAISQGPDEPAAENNTPEGRAKNRRTVIRIK